MSEQSVEFHLLKDAISFILKNPLEHKWTVQGLGMMRCYLSPQTRLHIWHKDLKAPYATKLHTHPWDFSSTIIAGHIEDVTYIEGKIIIGENYTKEKILCGEGGGPVGDITDIKLLVHSRIGYKEGETYKHKSNDIHRSNFEDGTVTIIQRSFLEDNDHAYVYRRRSSSFGSAEPRKATVKEIKDITTFTLRKYFGGPI